MRRHRHRPSRRLAGLLAAAVALGSAAGCTSAAGPQWPPGSNVGITIVSGSDTSISPGNNPIYPNENGMYQQLVNYWNAYEEKIYGFSVTLDVIPGGATAEHAEMLAAAQTRGEHYDIYNLDNQSVTEFADGGYIRPLQGLVNTSGFLAAPLRSAEDASGQLYAVPFTTDVGLLYYRSDFVGADEVNSLHSFQAMVNLARSEMLRHPGVSEGYAGQFASYEGLTVNALEAIWGNDRAAFASDGTIQNTAAVTRGLEDLVDAFTPGQTGRPVVPAAELYYQEEQAFQDFATGKTVFMRNWPIYYEQLAAGQPGTVSPHDVGVAPLPFPSALGGQDLAIASSSPDPRQALEVIDFLTSAAAERCLFAVGGFPATRTSAYAPGNWLPAGPISNQPLCGTKAGASVRIGPEIEAALGTAIPRPTTRYYTDFTSLLQNQVWNMLSQASQGDETNSGVAAVVSSLTAHLRAAAAGNAP
jgi:multiple sugar transport system substrate-binding protein